MPPRQQCNREDPTLVQTNGIFMHFGRKGRTFGSIFCQNGGFLPFRPLFGHHFGRNGMQKLPFRPILEVDSFGHFVAELVEFDTFPKSLTDSGEPKVAEMTHSQQEAVAHEDSEASR